MTFVQYFFTYDWCTLAPLSNNILIFCALEFLFSSKFTGLIWECVEILPRSLGGEITPKVIDDKFLELIIVHYLFLIFY